MATKNLGRTAIEGGRIGRYKFLVGHYESQFRAATRTYLRTVSSEGDERDFTPMLSPVSKRGNQTDKLNGVYKMLDSMVGRPWSKVFAEICERFDGRTLAGRHVLYDHILQEIDPHPHVPSKGPWRTEAAWFVDKHGIFRKKQFKGEQGKRPHDYISVKRATALKEWLNGRGVIRQGSKLYWGVGINSWFGSTETKASFNFYSYMDRVYTVGYGRPINGHPSYRFYGDSYNWRQNKGLSREETQFFLSLPAWLQEQVIVFDPEVETKKAA